MTRLTPDAFRASLKALGFTAQGFASYARTDAHNVRDWLHGRREIPGWVGVMLYLTYRVREEQYAVGRLEARCEGLVKAARAVFAG